MKTYKKEIAESIAKGNTDDALKLAREFFPQLSNEISVLNGTYTRLKKRFNGGAMGLDKYNEVISRISFDLIEMLPEEGSNNIPKDKSNPIKRLISFQLDFLKGVISEFSRSKLILFASLFFVVLVGSITILLMSQIMPTMWGKTVLATTLFAFFTLIISSLGFLNTQIKQFKGSKSFLKFQEYSEKES